MMLWWRRRAGGVIMRSMYDYPTHLPDTVDTVPAAHLIFMSNFGGRISFRLSKFS
jgi:hypothetical protein